MSNIIPKLKLNIWENIGNELYITNPNLSDNETTYIAVDSASGASAFTVDNGLKFSTSEYVVIGKAGAEKSELLRIHTSTTPTATTITLASNTSFSHSRGETITFIPYDQILIERSTDGGSSYSTLCWLR